MTRVPLDPPARLVDIEVDGRPVRAPEGSTILDALRTQGCDTPTLCYGDTIDPANACRVCVVEAEGSRVLVPSCSRKVEDGMSVSTDTPRTHHARRMVLEFLGSSVDLSTTPGIDALMQQYGADPDRFGTELLTVAQPTKIDNDLYVRDYSKCILCYKCVQACGEDAQNTFAIAVAGRGFDARISTEGNVPLPESACVYCGNCIQVCPTGALMFKSEHDLREEGEWREEEQTVTQTICTYCGVGCNLELHVQDNSVVKVTSPPGHDITHGNLCIKGRFGFQHAQARDGG